MNGNRGKWLLLRAICVGVMGCVLASSSGYARPERIRPGIAYYSDDFVESGLVRDLAEEKNYEEVYQFFSYYEAVYDDAERVVVFKEYRRGELIRTDEYRYAPDGGLIERRTTRPGKPVETSTPGAAAGEPPEGVDPE